MENYTFWSEIGSGFEEPGSTTLPRIPRSISPVPILSINFSKTQEKNFKSRLPHFVAVVLVKYVYK